MDEARAQLPLFGAPEPIVVSGGRYRYVPVLLDRPGERDALRRADDETWARMMPLIQEEVASRKGVDPSERALFAAGYRIKDAVGDHPVYVDVMPSGRRRVAAPIRAVTAVMEGMDRANVRFVPVYRIGAGNVARAVRPWAERASGVALRVRGLEPLAQGTRSLASVLLAEAEVLRASPGSIDVMVDLAYIDPLLLLPFEDVHTIVREVTAAAPWRSVALLGTCVPQSLSAIREGTMGSLSCTEWQLWHQLPGDLDVGFGDYAIQGSRSPYSGRGGPMRANLRYTIGDEIVVARGVGAINALPPREREAQYRDLCRQILLRPEFGGQACCWGDGVIEDCALGRIPAGNQNVWRGAGTSHHLKSAALRLAAEQVAVLSRAVSAPTRQPAGSPATVSRR